MSSNDQHPDKPAYEKKELHHSEHADSPDAPKFSAKPVKLNAPIYSDIPLQGTQRHPNNSEHITPVKRGRNAAVLIPLVKHLAEWHILYIRRAHNKNDRHSGQVAFPGGMTEPTDKSPAHTALRETSEEIGLARDRINLIGAIHQYITIGDVLVNPVVGIVQWPSNMQLQTSEVARAFLIPLNWLKDSNNHTLRMRSDIDPSSNRTHPIVVFNEYDGEKLWGATARMTINFLKAVDDGDILLPTGA